MFKKSINMITAVSFIILSLAPYQNVYAQESIYLPPAGQILPLSSSFTPILIKGLKIDKKDPFKFDFVVNKGEQNIPEEQFKEETLKLVKYFLASLAIPEDDLWVNLSPYEKNRITTQELGVTGMGKDLLSQDYVLKQITSSLIYPEGETGKKFWAKVYALAEEKYHTTNIPVNTFNKVWIVPQKAVVYENPTSRTAYVVESKLKVMLEEDYLALTKHGGQPGGMALAVSPSTLPSELGLNVKASQGNNYSTNSIGSQIVREIVIPQLTKEVNEGKNFANLRQITNSLILAAWFKRSLKASILAKLYVDQKKMAGVDVHDRTVTERIFQQYLKAYKKGVYNYIKEEEDPVTHTIVPRKYFSGGVVERFKVGENLEIENSIDSAQLSGDGNVDVAVKLNNSSSSFKKNIVLSNGVLANEITDEDARKHLNSGASAFEINHDGSIESIPSGYWDQYFGTKQSEGIAPNVYLGLDGNVYADLNSDQAMTLEDVIKQREDTFNPLIKLTEGQLGEFNRVINDDEVQREFAQRFHGQTQEWFHRLYENPHLLKSIIDHLDKPGAFERYRRNLILPPVKTPYGQVALFIHVANPFKAVPPHFHGDNEVGGFAWIVPLNVTFLEEKWLGLQSHRGQSLITLNQADSKLHKPGEVYSLVDEEGAHVMLNTSLREYGAFLELYILPPGGIKGFDIPVPQEEANNEVNVIVHAVNANRLLTFDDFKVAAIQGKWQPIYGNYTRTINYLLNGSDTVIFEVKNGRNAALSQESLKARFNSKFFENHRIYRDPEQPRIFVIFDRDAAMISQDSIKPVQSRVATKDELLDPRNNNRLASGIIRTGEFSFQHVDKPVDLVVIGGGAAGLATAFQGVDSNLDGVVLLESGLIGQSFTNGAMPFEDMRTPPRRISLIQLGANSKASQSLNLQNPEYLSQLRQNALLGEKAEETALGINPKIARSKDYDKDENLGNATIPTARAVLYQHFIDVADAIVKKGGYIQENDPVSTIRKLPGGLFLVSTKKGKQVIARNVVLATGVGGEKLLQSLDELASQDPDKFTVIKNSDDILLNNLSARIPIFQSHFLYDPNIIDYLKSLPSNSAIAIAGGGQSAGNAVVFIHRVRPDLVVHLFAKNPLTQGPSQMPSGLRTQRQMFDQVTNRQLQEQGQEEAGPTAFGVPITGSVFDYLQIAKSKGVFVEHIGNYFDNEHYSIETKLVDGQRLALIKDKNSSDGEAVKINAFVSAVGYMLDLPEKDPLYWHLKEGNLIELSKNGEVVIGPDGLTSIKDDHLFVSGIALGSQGSVTDGTTHGPTIRARVIVEKIKGISSHVDENDLVKKTKADFERFKQLTHNPKVAAFLTLAANQPGEDIVHIEHLYEEARHANGDEEAARYVADVAGQSGKVIKEDFHFPIPSTSRGDIVDRVFATEQPAYLFDDGKQKIDQLFDEIDDLAKDNNLAKEQLLYAITQFGVGEKKTRRLYNSFSDIPNPFVRSILVRAAINYLPPHVNDRAQSTVLEAKADKAQINGGIDLSRENDVLQIKRDASGFPLPLQFQDLAMVHINGLTPVIIGTEPIVNLSAFLGVK